MTPRTAALALAALVFGHAGAARAFKEPGHRAIEVAAYRKLLGMADLKTGQSKLRTLVDHGVLEPPSSPLPQPSEVLDSGYEMLLVESLVVHSHMPDHLMDRQLQADRQCFHFNARGAHFTLTDATEWGATKEGETEGGIPRGLIEDAYVECIGVADALLRGILFDPQGSRKQHTDIYALMHMIEDSYSDAHVARAASAGVGSLLPNAVGGAREHGDILFVKPWNLRTWARYFSAPDGAPVRAHFAENHHMGSDTRDLGYLIGPTDEDYESKRKEPRYMQRVYDCLVEARAMVRPKSKKLAEHPLKIQDLYGDLVPPESCLSDRALAARDAVADLLSLVADFIPLVVAPEGVRADKTTGPSVMTVGALADGTSFEDAWLAYRMKYLDHRIPELTRTMTMRVPSLAVAPDPRALGAREARRDRVASANSLTPREFKEAGFGLGVEVRGGTPLWLGLDTFVSRKSSSHNRTVVLLDTLGWGLQVRLPLENEIGERPVGAAFDIGPGLPLPLSELIGLDEVQIYVGARFRISYTAQAIFTDETRHAFEFGLGGIAVDAVVGKQAWVGMDLFRRMYYWDLWDSDASAWAPLTFGLGGGVAIDAL
jgi:hypothetical protein